MARDPGCWSSRSPTGCTTCEPCGSCRRRSRPGARETLEVIAPLAHRLGMATVKWELEDLSFAILHPKRYEEIVRLVADRHRRATPTWRKVRAEVNTALEWHEDPRHRRGQAQALLVDLPEDDRQGPRLRRHPRPGRACGSCAMRSATATPAVGVVHALWQPMPGRFKDYIASRGSASTSRCTPPSSARRASRWRCRSAPCPHRRVRHRRALALQRRSRAATGSASAGHRRDRRHGLDAPAARLAAARPPTRGSSSSRCATTLRSREIFVFTPGGT